VPTWVFIAAQAGYVSYTKGQYILHFPVNSSMISAMISAIFFRAATIAAATEFRGNPTMIGGCPQVPQRAGHQV
jgi:hypothetical protein